MLSKLLVCFVFQPVTQGDITEYQVYYNGTTINVTSSTTTLTFTAPSLPNGVFTGTIFVMVTAVRGSEKGPASEPVTDVIYGKYVHVHMVQLLSKFTKKACNLS